MPNIVFVNEGKTIEAVAGSNLRKVAGKNNIQLYSGLDVLLNCRGNGLCGTCRIEVVDGKGVSPMKPIEEGSMMSWFPWMVRSVPKNHRLACQSELTNDCQIKTHPQYSIDKEATKERMQMFGIWTVLGGIFTAMLGLMALDIVKLM
ncbi:MAG: (2Fe-2S)-binding protein [Ignavibacteriales bacterium]|nr:(2Fe-2S)-binding protein [Ignavibacteriales bacterium]